MKNKTTPTTNAEVVFIKRESHLGYCAYAATIENGKVINERPLMKTPDLEFVALQYATDHLEENLR